MRIGIDVGGTFTDVVLVDDQGNFHYTKTPSTRKELAQGVLNGLEDILQLTGYLMGDIHYLTHGTTVGTNAIIERKGARTGLITNKGFEDVLEIRRVARPKEATFDFMVDNPPPLVPRYLRKGVIGRINSKGQVVVALDEDSVREAVDSLKRDKVEAISIILLFSFLNPSHEQKVAEICRETFPEAIVSLSSKICPEFREYERTSTTVMNSYLGPVIERYMDNLVSRLREKHGDVNLLIMQSNGGSMSVEAAKRYAASMINSGPAAGALAAAYISKLLGKGLAIGADMGGTTFDISVIDKGMPRTTTWGGVTEYPIKLPMVDMKTIGAGGGSIGWIDKGGALNVGPESQGAEPGPACYGLGGTLPTVTDANLVLGRLNPDYFLGGKLKLYPERARQAIKEHVADRIGLSVEEAALGIIKVSNANMVKGISGVSVERGYDLREFILVAFGGACPLHAAALARELNMSQVVVPPMCGDLSAFGLVVSDIMHDYNQTLAKKQKDIKPQELLASFRVLEDNGVNQLRHEGVKDEDIVLEWSGDLRYEGQSWELNIPIPRTPTLGHHEIQNILSDFHKLHMEAYSYCNPEQLVEFINLRVRAIGKNPPVVLRRQAADPTPLSQALKEKRAIYFEGSGFIEVPIYDREKLGPGTRLIGPCLIEETISTVLVPQGCSSVVDEYSNFIILVGGSEI